MRVLHLELRKDLNGREYQEAVSHVPGLIPYLSIPNDSAMDILRGNNRYFQYVDAAETASDNKSTAFELTNSIDTEWFKADDDRVMPTGLSRRSTSCNDVMVDDAGGIFVVKMVGFERLTITPKELDVLANEQEEAAVCRPVGA